jgi:serine/threonine protein kinase
MMSPEDQRRKRNTAKDPAAAILERRDRHNVTRPETREEFLALDFSSRCAVAGLQLGRTKVFLRRDAFDRIESLRSDKFFSAAATIQKIVRGKRVREEYLMMRAAAIIVQSVMRMKLAAIVVSYRRYNNAAIRVQCAWRCFMAQQFLGEIQLARKYAAIIIQRAYRSYRFRLVQPTEDQVIRAIVQFQAMYRGKATRARVAIMLENRERALAEAAAAAAVVVAAPTPAPLIKVAPVQKSRQSPDDSTSNERQLKSSLRSSRGSGVDANALVPSATLSQLFDEIQEENWAMVEGIVDRHPELAEAADLKSGELALHKISRHASAWPLLVDMVLVLFPKALIHRDNMGALPIHHASAHDNLAALEIIYSAYKDGVNEVDKMGRLPLHVAANYDAVDAVKYLLSKSPEGAYTMIYRPPVDSGGGLPLHIACSNHASIGVITALLAENFASAKRTDENGDLPLHLLLRCGEVVDPVVVKTLLTCFSGALSRTDMHGDLPLAISIKNQCRSAVVNAVLMQYPEAAGILNGESHSPLFLAFKHNADDRTIMGLLNHAPELATAIDRSTGLLPIQMATENEHSHFIVHNLLKRDLPIDVKEKVRAQLVPHHYSWNHVVSNTDDLYHQVVTKILQSCTQPQVLALAHVEGPDGRIALASATPVCKHEMRVMLRLFNTLEVVNQRPAYTNPVSDTQIFYALRYDPPTQHNGTYTILHEEKKENGENDYVEDCDDHSHVSGISRTSLRSTITSRSIQTIEDKLRHIRKEKGQQVIAKLTSRSDVVERELKIRKDYHLSRHYVPAFISVHHTVQHAAYSEAMAEPGYCITMEGADTTAENLMLDMRKTGKQFPSKALKRIGISLLHLHEHGIIHGDFGTHNIGKFGSRWKLLGVGGSVVIGLPTDPSRGFYHPPEAIMAENKRIPPGKKHVAAEVVSVHAHPTYDIWAYGVAVYEALAKVPLSVYSCRGKRAMTPVEVGKIGAWDESSLKKALKQIPDDPVARDLLHQLLHHDAEKRLGTMRQVLDHPFFTGGNLPPGSQGLVDQMSPQTLNSGNSSKNSHSSSNGQGGQAHRGIRSSTIGPGPFRTHSASSGGVGIGRNSTLDPPAVKVSFSTESVENRENTRESRAGGTSKLMAEISSPSGSSVRSSRSFGDGFRKLRSSLRRQNA